MSFDRITIQANYDINDVVAAEEQVSPMWGVDDTTRVTNSGNSLAVNQISTNYQSTDNLNNTKETDYSNISSSSSNVLYGNTITTSKLLQPFENNISISKSDKDLRDSLQSTVGNLTGFSVVQDYELIDYVDITKPLVLDSDNLEIIFNDINGEEYTYNIYQSTDLTYFALCSVITPLSYDAQSNTLSQIGNTYVQSLKNSYNIFKLYQDLQPSTYYVYAFNDIPNNQITYNKYLGQVNIVDGIAIGNQIPKYVDLVKTSTLDPDTLDYASYISSAKINFKINGNNVNFDSNGEYSGNVVLTEVNIPTLDLIVNDDKNTYSLAENCVLDPDFTLFTYTNSRISFNDLADKDNKSPDEFYNTLSNLIRSYSLYSPVNIIKTTSEYVHNSSSRSQVTKIHINPVTLYVPTLIYTYIDGNNYQYIPYENVDDLSDMSIEISAFLNADNSSTVTLDVIKEEKSNPILSKTISWNIDEDKPYYTVDNQMIHYQTAIIENREWLSIGSIDDKYSIFIKINNVIQDEQLNFVEFDFNNKFNIDVIEDNILHIAVITDSDIFTQKITLKRDTTIKLPLYNYKSVKVNDVSYIMIPNMTYVDYLGFMTTSYNLKYVTGIEYNYGWKFDPNVSSIQYITDVLFERETLNMTYKYWSPKDNTYQLYQNKVLEYNGNFYGSDIFEQINIDNDTNSDFDNCSNIEYKLTQVFKRTKIIDTGSKNKKDNGLVIYTDNAYSSSSFIKDNNELKYKTYSNVPFELKNESTLVFNGKYKFVAPEISYIINAQETNGAVILLNENEAILGSYTCDVKEVGNNYYVANKYRVYYNYINYENQTNKLLRVSQNSSNKDIYVNKYNYIEYDDIDIKNSEFLKNISEKSAFLITNNSSSNNNLNFVNFGTPKSFENIFNDDKDKITKKFWIQYKWSDEANYSYNYTSINDILKFDINNNDEIRKKTTLLLSLNFNDGKTSYYFTSIRAYVNETYLHYSEKFKNNDLYDQFIKSISSINKVIEDSHIILQAASGKYTLSGDKIVSEYKYDIINYPLTSPGFSYSASSIITTNGYWKPEFDEVIKPFITISYSYASNSIDISNAYIVPTTRNERLGFVHNPRITYNVFVTSYVQEYKYTYNNRKNVELAFIEDDDHKIIQTGDKYYGLDSSEGADIAMFNVQDKIVKQESKQTDNAGGSAILRSKSVGDNLKLKDYYNIDIDTNEYVKDIFGDNPKFYNNFKDFWVAMGVNVLENTNNTISPYSNYCYCQIDNKLTYVYLGNVKSLSKYDTKTPKDLLLLYKWFKNVNNLQNDYDNLDKYIEKLEISSIFSIATKCDFYLVAYNDETYVCVDYKGENTEKHYIYNLGKISEPRVKIQNTQLKELHRRLIVSQERHIEEVVLQEEEYIPQNAQIDTPFGIVNGKKVIVTDEVYVPETYADIVSIDPTTYEYFTNRVVLTEAYYSYTYEVEDIPLITAAYIYNDQDGIKIQGMDTLVEILSGLRTGTDSNGNSYIIPSSLPSSSITKESFERMSKSFNAYMMKLTDSLVYINAAIDRTNNQIGYVAYTLGNNEDNNVSLFRTLSNTILDNGKNKVNSDRLNTSNSINAQKSMFNKLTQSIDNQTTTLSKMMLISMLGQGTAYTTEGANAITGLLNSMSGVVPQNWQTVERTGYEYTYEVLINSYKALSYKHTKVIGRDLKHASYVTRTGSYIYENPAYISLTYSIFADKTLSSNERIGLHLKKETRNFTYNGYVYKENYYSYQNIADILADLHISNRLPTRKEFIVDVSKRLYINSDFIFSYTSPNEYAVRAIRRADILWSELVKANVIEDSKSSQRPLPEIKEPIKWWSNRNILNRFATILDLDIRKLITLPDSEFVKIDSIIKSKIGLTLVANDTSDIIYRYLKSTEYPLLRNRVLAPNSKITTVNRTLHLADIFGITHESLEQHPEVITELKTMTEPYKANYTLEDTERFEQSVLKV